MTLSFTVLSLIFVATYTLYYLLKRRKMFKHHVVFAALVGSCVYILLSPSALNTFNQIANAMPSIVIQLPGASTSPAATATPSPRVRPTATPHPFPTPRAKATVAAQPTSTTQAAAPTETANPAQLNVGLLFLGVMFLLVASIIFIKARARKHETRRSRRSTANWPSNRASSDEWRSAPCAECSQRGRKLKEYRYRKGRSVFTSSLCSDCAGRLEAVPFS